MYSAKGQEGAHHAGFEVSTAKRENVRFCWGLGWAVEWCYIEGYLNAPMYKFVYMVYVHRAGWWSELLDCIVSFVRRFPPGWFTCHILWADGTVGTDGSDWIDFLRESFDLRKIKDDKKIKRNNRNITAVKLNCVNSTGKGSLKFVLSDTTDLIVPANRGLKAYSQSCISLSLVACSSIPRCSVHTANVLGVCRHETLWDQQSSHRFTELVLICSYFKIKFSYWTEAHSYPQ